METDSATAVTPRESRARDRVAWLAALSLALAALVPLTSRSGTGDLSGYTDHLRHAAMVELALRHGLDVYRAPYGELLHRTPLVRAPREWEGVGYLYPPGALALFAPLALLGKVIRDDDHFARVCLFYVLLWTHVAIFYVCRSLTSLPGKLRIAAGLLAWALLLHAGLCGQYEAAWVLCAGFAIGAFASQRHAQAIGWICAAALLHQRAMVLAPVGIAALWASLRGPGARWKPPREWPWPALAAGAVAIGVAFACTAAAARWAGAARNVSPLLEEPAEPVSWAAVALTAAAGALCARWRQWLLLGAVGVVGSFALVDSRHWWHATIALPALLLMFAAPPARSTTLQAGMLLWFVGMQRVFGERPLELFKQLGAFLRST